MDHNELINPSINKVNRTKKISSNLKETGYGNEVPGTYKNGE